MQGHYVIFSLLEKYELIVTNLEKNRQCIFHCFKSLEFKIYLCLHGYIAIGKKILEAAGT